MFRGYNANFIGCFAEKLLDGNPFHAEVVGALRAIEIAKERHWNNLWIEIDSQLLVSTFKKDYMSPCSLRNIWSNALIVTKNMNFMVTHIYRKDNQCANDLTNFGLTLSDFRFFDNIPNPLFFAATIWWACRHRNKMRFNNKIWSINHLSLNIKKMVETFKACFPPLSNGASPDRLINWNKSNHYSVILNVDGSCLGAPIRACFGLVLRNNVGFYWLGFYDYINNSFDILQAE